MYRHEIMTQIANDKAIAIVREQTAEAGHRVVSTLVSGGMHVLEVTCSTPGAFALVDAWRDGPTLLGVGTVLSETEAVLAAQAGARFIVTPNTDVAVIQEAHRRGLATIVGCGSVSEIVTALQAGADAIKLFPASQLGLGFLPAVHGPIPWAPLIPVGGVDATNARKWLDAGAIAVGLGSKLTTGDEASILDRVATLRAQLD